jgi:hypothetical protein
MGIKIVQGGPTQHSNYNSGFKNLLFEPIMSQQRLSLYSNNERKKEARLFSKSSQTKNVGAQGQKKNSERIDETHSSIIQH